MENPSGDAALIPALVIHSLLQYTNLIITPELFRATAPADSPAPVDLSAQHPQGRRFDDRPDPSDLGRSSLYPFRTLVLSYNWPVG